MILEYFNFESDQQLSNQSPSSHPTVTNQSVNYSTKDALIHGTTQEASLGGVNRNGETSVLQVFPIIRCSSRTTNSAGM